MTLAEILAANVEYLKINNIEKSMGLTKTALVRIIARKEIPEKHKEKVEKWWNDWVMNLIQGTYNPEKPFIDKKGKETSAVAGKSVTVTLTEKNYTTPSYLSDMEKQFQEELSKIKNKKV